MKELAESEVAEGECCWGLLRQAGPIDNGHFKEIIDDLCEAGEIIAKQYRSFYTADRRLQKHYCL